MLQGRLSRFALAAAALVAAAGCSEGGALEENVVRPGITAIEQATQLACSGDAATLRTAMDAYEVLAGTPAPDEATLVGEQYLRDESELWDIVDGQLVPTDPGCDSVAADAPDSVDIVTSTEPPQSAADMLAAFTDEQIAAVGGAECARQLAEIFSGVDRYVAEVGSGPADLRQLVTTGYLDDLPTLWEITADVLVPAPDSDCLSLD